MCVRCGRSWERDANWIRGGGPRHGKPLKPRRTVSHTRAYKHLTRSALRRLEGLSGAPSSTPTLLRRDPTVFHRTRSPVTWGKTRSQRSTRIPRPPSTSHPQAPRAAILHWPPAHPSVHSRRGPLHPPVLFLPRGPPHVRPLPPRLRSRRRRRRRRRQRRNGGGPRAPGSEEGGGRGRGRARGRAGAGAEAEAGRGRAGEERAGGRAGGGGGTSSTPTSSQRSTPEAPARRGPPPSLRTRGASLPPSGVDPGHLPRDLAADGVGSGRLPPPGPR